MREDWERWEDKILAPWAAKAAKSAGRALPERECPLRTVYQRDRDRIIHSKAFRRLKHKTQVFVNPQGDHFRTRLTHTLEVTQIARTIARSLALNEDLTEAIALGHDLGHTPFGHAGERALAAILGNFCHNQQSLRLVDFIEREGRGLNLSAEVREGIEHHSGKEPPQTLEGMVVRLSDRIAYVNHDIDDALRAGLLHREDLPAVAARLGGKHSERINALVNDVVRESAYQPRVSMSEQATQNLDELRDYLFTRVYFRPEAKAEEERLHAMIRRLFAYYLDNTGELPPEYRLAEPKLAAADYVAGMTDPFALAEYERLFPCQT
ncbi:MAG: deoxyguanosinetriphosphate triphosphohydrolase [Clostridiales bacterium]|nr:deoxyguanosinetriphosphate triphosphohydrolase [Clostridiales bacterium]